MSFPGSIPPSSSGKANFKENPITAASQIPTYEGSALKLIVRSFVAVDAITLEYLTQDADGIHAQRQDFKLTATDGSANTFVIPLSVGLLLYCKASVPYANAVRHGDLYLTLDMIWDARSATSPTYATLLERYVTSASAAFFPGSPYEASTDRLGAPFQATQANPGAGAEWVYTVPANMYLRFRGLRATFTASATAANRIVGIKFGTSAANMSFAVFPTAITANISINLFFNTMSGPAVSDILGGSLQLAVIPTAQYIYVTSGLTIRSVTENIDAGDAYTSIALDFERWISA